MDEVRRGTLGAARSDRKQQRKQISKAQMDISKQLNATSETPSSQSVLIAWYKCIISVREKRKAKTIPSGAVIKKHKAKTEAEADQRALLGYKK